MKFSQEGLNDQERGVKIRCKDGKRIKRDGCVARNKVFVRGIKRSREA